MKRNSVCWAIMTFLLFSQMSIAQDIVIPQKSSADFPGGAIDFFRKKAIFSGKVESVSMHKPNDIWSDHEIVVRVLKSYRGNVSSALSVLVANESEGGVFKVGEDYLFKLELKNGKYFAYSPKLSSTKIFKDNVERLEFVTSGSKTDSEILEKFKAFNRIKAEKWKKECFLETKGPDKQNCLANYDALLKY